MRIKGAHGNGVNDGNFAKAVIAKAAAGAAGAANEVAAAVGTAAELCCFRCHICLVCTFLRAGVNYMLVCFFCPT